ncbi:hypothetical protein LXL04_016953 [Taraxacum kok-saghyz]
MFMSQTGIRIGRIKELRKQKSNRKQKPLQSTADLKPVQVVCSGEVPNEGVGKKGEREHRDEGHGAISVYIGTALWIPLDIVLEDAMDVFNLVDGQTVAFFGVFYGQISDFLIFHESDFDLAVTSSMEKAWKQVVVVVAVMGSGRRWTVVVEEVDSGRDIVLN